MSEPTAVPGRRLQIKKYPNRRYYDATHSKHLTLEEIRALIQEGYDIEAVDAPTGTDITAQVLTQIILELDTPKLGALPVPLLVRLIRANDQLVKDFIEKYFNQALKSFFDYQRQLEEQLRRTHGLPSVFPSVTAWTKAMLQPFASAFAPASETADSPEASEGAREEERRLQEQVRELRKEIKELKKTRKKRPRARKKSSKN